MSVRIDVGPYENGHPHHLRRWPSSRSGWAYATGQSVNLR